MFAGPVRFALTGCLAFAVAVVPIGQPAAAQGEKTAVKATRVRTDLYDDLLPPGALARLGTVRFRQETTIGALAYSPDGKLLASAGDSVRVWEAATGKPLHRLKSTKKVDLRWTGTALAFTPDGKTLVCGGSGGLLFWDPLTGKLLRELPLRVREVPHGAGGGANREPANLLFTPDGKTFAWLHPDNTISLYESATGKETCRLEHYRDHLGYLGPVALSPDAQMLAVQAGGHVYFWEVATRKQLPHPKGFPAGSGPVAFLADGKNVALWCGDVLWDLSAGKERRRLKSDGEDMYRVAVSADGKTLLTAAYKAGTIAVWNTTTGKLGHRIKLPNSGIPCFAAAFAPDGRTVALGYMNQVIHLWNLETGKLSRTSDGPGHWVDALAFSADGTRLVTCDLAGFRSWDRATGKEIPRPPARSGGHSRRVFSRDGKVMAATNWPDPVIHLTDVATGKELRRLKGHKERVEALTFAADGRFLASGGLDGQLCLWETGSGRQLRCLQTEEQPRPLAFSPDGRLVVWTDEGSRVRMWDTSTGRERLQLRGHKHGVFAAAFSPDGWTLASGGQDGTLRLWETATGKEVLRFDGPPSVRNVRFSPEGNVLVSWSPGAYLVDGDKSAMSSSESVQLWDPATGKQICRLDGHQGTITAAAFSPDGQALATGSGDTTVLLWDMTTLRKATPALVLSHEALNARWADLAGEDAARAYLAAVALRAAAGESEPFLRQRLRPVALDHRRVPGLIADLSHDKFAVRRKALRDLEELQEVAVAPLREALAKPVALETRRRLEELLEKGERYRVPSGELLRTLRAVMVLERIGSADARQVLETLARGTPGARLTEEVRASLRRLTSRSAAP